MADRFEPIAIQPTDWFTGIDEADAPIITLVDNGYAIVLTLQQPKARWQVSTTMNHTDSKHLIAALSAMMDFQSRRLRGILDRSSQFVKKGEGDATSTETKIPPSTD